MYRSIFALNIKQTYMDPQTLKQRIIDGEMTDAELQDLLNVKLVSQPKKQGGGFLKTILKGFLEGYTAPNMWRMTLEAILILMVILGVVFLSYNGRIDGVVSSVILAFVLGFLFGKIK
jgi:lipopolysaccharide export LptBFGC system permease protein LptF